MNKGWTWGLGIFLLLVVIVLLIIFLIKKGVLKGFWNGIQKFADMISKNLILFAFFSIPLFIFSAISLVTVFLFPNWKVVLGAGIANTAFLIIWVYAGWTQVPEPMEWYITLFGKHFDSWKPGLHWIFPLFNWMEVPKDFHMGEQKIELHMNNDVTEGYGKGHVDFSDAQAPVESVFFFKVVDTEKAYKIKDIFLAIADIVDEKVRGYLTKYPIDKAIELKGQFNLQTIVDNVDLKATVPMPTAPPNIFLQNIKDSMGMEITRILIVDVQLPKEIADLRSKEAQAEIEKKIARVEKETTLINAEADAAALREVGDGLAQQIKDLVDSGGLTPAQAAEYLRELKKWGALSDKAVYLEGAASYGASAGAGFKSATGTP
ncbi:MAG: SPFH domain-containing protein [bacterium]